MEHTGNNSLADTNCPTSSRERSNVVERSNGNAADQLSVVNPDGSTLADTLNQLLSATPEALGLLDDPASLIQSNLNIGTTLLASLAPASSGDNPCGSDPMSGSVVGDGDYQCSIMEQISPPTVLPDLNVAMAEGMAGGISELEQLAPRSTELGGLQATEGDTIPLASAIQSLSCVSQSSEGSGHSQASGDTSTTLLPLQQGSTPSQSVPEKSKSAASGSSVPSPLRSSPSVAVPASFAAPSFPISSPVVQQVRPQSATSSTKVVYTVSPSATHAQSTPGSSVSLNLPGTASAPKPANTQPLQPTGGPTPSRFPPPCAVTPLSLPHQSVASPQLTSAATLTSGAKGLNLPLLQFLNLNFPSLKVKDLQDVLSINTLLTQVLKQQLNNPSSSATAALQQLGEFSKVGQSTLRTPLTSLATVTTVQSSPAATKVSSAQFVLPKPGISSLPSSVVGGASPRLGLQTGLSRPLTSPSVVAGSLRPSHSPGTAVKGMVPLSSEGRQSQSASSGLGINLELLSKQSSSLLSTLASPSAPASTAAGSSRKAVLVQILNKTSSTTPTTVTTTPPSKTPILIPRMKTLSKSPLILNRHNRLPQQLSLTSTISGSSVTKPSPPVSSLCVSLSLPALKGSQQLELATKKRRTPSRKSAHQITTDTSQQQLSRTVVQPAESEAMEVDVGHPVQKMKLPRHLNDHSYSLYNPEEAEKQRIVVTRTFSFVSSIPPARLSYAPQVPDSPSTLHKLLKVLPKKNSRQHSSPPRSGRGFGCRGRGGRRVGRSHTRGRGKASAMKAGSTPTLETVSDPSSSDQSGSEEPSRKVRSKCVCTAGHMGVLTMCVCVCVRIGGVPSGMLDRGNDMWTISTYPSVTMSYWRMS